MAEIGEHLPEEALAKLEMAAHLEAYQIPVMASLRHLVTLQEHQSEKAYLAIEIQAGRAEKEVLDRKASEPAKISAKITRLESKIEYIKNWLHERWEALVLCIDQLQD